MRADWEALDTDLPALAGDLVSVVGVTDPFEAYDEALLHRTFGDLVRPFRRHYIVDLEQVEAALVAQAGAGARRALRSVESRCSTSRPCTRRPGPSCTGTSSTVMA
ncbi:MAG: hypothetical protein U0869_01070 [Chloroflexota bacterium]